MAIVQRTDALAVGPSAVEDVLAGRVAADEGDRLDQRLIADEVDGVDAAVKNAEDALRQAGPLAQLGNDRDRSGIALAGLDDERRAGRDGHRNRPERDHGLKVSIVGRGGRTGKLNGQIAAPTPSGTRRV